MFAYICLALGYPSCAADSISK